MRQKMPVIGKAVMRILESQIEQFVAETVSERKNEHSRRAKF